LGGTTKIETLVGKVEVKIKPGTMYDEVLKLEGMGVNRLPPNQG